MVESKVNDNTVPNKKFHELTGGRIRYDLRFFGDPKAIQIRELIIEIEQRRQFKDSLRDLTGEIGCISQSILSLAIGGRAGKKPRYELGGKSSTDHIILRLEEILKEENLREEYKNWW